MRSNVENLNDTNRHASNSEQERSCAKIIWKCTKTMIAHESKPAMTTKITEQHFLSGFQSAMKWSSQQMRDQSHIPGPAEKPRLTLRCRNADWHQQCQQTRQEKKCFVFSKCNEWRSSQHMRDQKSNAGTCVHAQTDWQLSRTIQLSEQHANVWKLLKAAHTKTHRNCNKFQPTGAPNSKFL